MSEGMSDQDSKALGIMSRMKMGFFGGNKEASSDEGKDFKAPERDAEGLTQEQRDLVAKREADLKDRNAQRFTDHYGSNPKGGSGRGTGFDASGGGNRGGN